MIVPARSEWMILGKDFWTYGQWRTAGRNFKREPALCGSVFFIYFNVIRTWKTQRFARETIRSLFLGLPPFFHILGVSLDFATLIKVLGCCFLDPIPFHLKSQTFLFQPFDG